MAGERLLRDHEQRVAFRTPDGVGQRVVQLGFVRIVGVGGRVVLGYHGDVVRAHTELGEIAHQLGAFAAHTRGKRTQARSRNGRVRAIRVGMRESDHAGHRQTQLQRDVAARQQDGSAALRFHESTTTTVVRTREEPRVDSLGVHLLRIGGGVHVAESDHGFHSDVVDRAGHHEVGFAEGDLVYALFERDRRRGTGGDRLDHVAVAADVGLHHMCRDDVRQRLLQDVGRDFVVEEAVEVELAHGGHAAEARALRGRHHGGVHRLEDFRRRESRGKIGIHRGDDVPQGDLVNVGDHGCGDAPLDRIEALRELAAHRTGHGGAARHADHGSGVAGHVPFAGFRVGFDGGVRFVELDVLFGDFTGRNTEGHIVVEEDFGLLLVCAASVVVAHALFERADAGTRHDLIVVAFRDVLLGHQIAVDVVPARLRIVVPCEQSHVPGQFEHRSRGKVHLAVGMDAEFRFETGSPGAPWSEFADGNDHDLVFRTCRHVAPIVQIDACLAWCARGRQRLDQRGFVRRTIFRFRRFVPLRRLGIGHGFGAKRLDVDRLGSQAARQVHVKRGHGGFLTGFAGGQIEQSHRDFGGRIGFQTVTLHHRDQRIVAAHQTGAAHPADLRMREGHAGGPRLFGTGAVHNRVERALHLAVRAVAAEDAAVRRARQNHMQPVPHIGVGSDAGKARDRTFHTPQHESRLRFEQFAGIGQRAAHRRRREREEQGRLICGLEDGGGGAGGLPLLVAHPLYERVHIAIAGKVRRNKPQFRIRRSMFAIALLGPCLHARFEAVRRGDHGGAAGQQAVDHLRGDGVRRDARHHGHVSRESGGCGRFVRMFQRFGSDLAECGGEIGVITFDFAGIPGRLVRNGLAQADEAAVQLTLAVVGASEILSCGRPTVVEQDGFAFVETGFHLLGPVGAEFGFDCGRHGRVARIGVGFPCGSGHAQLVQHKTRCRCEHAVRAGHLRREFVQRGGIDDRAACGAARIRHGDGDALCGGDLLHGGVNQRVGLCNVGNRVGLQRGKVPAAGAGALTGFEHQGGHHVRGPSFTQLPDLGDALVNLRGFHAGCTEHAPDTVAHDVGEHRSEGLVVRRDLVHQRAQCDHGGFGGSVHGSHAQFGTDVHEQLVAAGRDAVGQSVGGVGRADLLRLHLGGIGQQHGDRVGCPERDVVDGRAGRSACGSRLSGGRSGSNRRSGSGGFNGSGNRSRGNRRSRGGIVGIVIGNERIGIGHVYAALITANVVNRHVATRELRQSQGLGAKVGERRSVAETDLDILLDAASTLLHGGEQQGLGLDPTHRRRELPGQQFGKQQSAELLIVFGIRIPHPRIVQRLFDAFGRHDLEDLRGEFLRHLERNCHKVRNITSLQTTTVIDVFGKQRVELVAEFRHSLA